MFSCKMKRWSCFFCLTKLEPMKYHFSKSGKIFVAGGFIMNLGRLGHKLQLG